MTVEREIVLVGNGPSLMQAEMGAAIDAFSTVVRFNGYVLDGFERYVGSRTTIWSRWYALDKRPAKSDFSAIWINMPAHERTREKIDRAQHFIADYQIHVEIVPSSSVANALQRDLFGGPHETKWPSSGLLAIAHALDAGYRVTLAGFDSWEREPYHYFEQHDRTNSHHVPQVERAYIAALVAAGRISKLQK